MKVAKWRVVRQGRKGIFTTVGAPTGSGQAPNTEWEKREEKKRARTAGAWGCWAGWCLTIKDYITTESTYLSRKF